MDDDAFRFGNLTQQVKGRLRVGRFLSASMVVHLRFNCHFRIHVRGGMMPSKQWLRTNKFGPERTETPLGGPSRNMRLSGTDPARARLAPLTQVIFSSRRQSG